MLPARGREMAKGGRIGTGYEIGSPGPCPPGAAILACPCEHHCLCGVSGWLVGATSWGAVRLLPEPPGGRWPAEGPRTRLPAHSPAFCSHACRATRPTPLGENSSRLFRSPCPLGTQGTPGKAVTRSTGSDLAGPEPGGATSCQFKCSSTPRHAHSHAGRVPWPPFPERLPRGGFIYLSVFCTLLLKT